MEKDQCKIFLFSLLHGTLFTLMYDFSSSSYSEVQPMMSLILLQMLHLEKRRMKERERGREKEGNVQHRLVCIINKSSTSFETSGFAGQCRTGRGVLCFVWWSVEVAPFTCSCSVTAPLEKQIALCVWVCVCPHSTLTMAGAPVTRDHVMQACH